MKRICVLCALVVAGCPKGGDKPKPIEPVAKGDAQTRLLPDDDGGLVVPPPAPPLPTPPASLPQVQLPSGVTPEALVLGEVLFADPQLSGGKLSCASCHDPQHGYAGAGRQDTALGKANLRRAPTLVNLAWVKEYGWDGRYASLGEQLEAHVRGQLGVDYGEVMTRVSQQPTYRALFSLVGVEANAAASDALRSFVLTRYSGDAPWDRLERRPDVPADIKAGYQLFNGKAQCSVCHTPPLYTDGRYHRLGLIATPDEGRGRVEPAQKGAFRTPTLRGAASRLGFFHDGSAKSLDEAIDWHLAGGTGQGADASIVDPALKKISLTVQERAALGAFVRALTPSGR